AYVYNEGPEAGQVVRGWNQSASGTGIDPIVQQSGNPRLTLVYIVNRGPDAVGVFPMGAKSQDDGYLFYINEDNLNDGVRGPRGGVVDASTFLFKDKPSVETPVYSYLNPDVIVEPFLNRESRSFSTRLVGVRLVGDEQDQRHEIVEIDDPRTR